MNPLNFQNSTFNLGFYQQSIPETHKLSNYQPQTFVNATYVLSNEHQRNVAQNNNNLTNKNHRDCLDTLMTTNSSSCSEQIEETQQKDSNDETKKIFNFFVQNKYPKKEELEELAKSTNKSVKHLETWFKNRRRALALKGLFPNYQRKNKFSKEQIGTLKEFFQNLKKPKKTHYEQIHQKLNQACSIKNIKNWFNHYKKKIKLGVSERKKRNKETLPTQQNIIKTSNELEKKRNENNDDDENTNENLTKINNNSSFIHPMNFTPIQTMQTNQAPANTLFLLPLSQNTCPYVFMQQPMNNSFIIQNYSVNPLNNYQPRQTPMILMNDPNKTNNFINNGLEAANFSNSQANYGYVFVMNQQPNMMNIPKNQSFQVFASQRKDFPLTQNKMS